MGCGCTKCLSHPTSLMLGFITLKNLWQFDRWELFSYFDLGCLEFEYIFIYYLLFTIHLFYSFERERDRDLPFAGLEMELELKPAPIWVPELAMPQLQSFDSFFLFFFFKQLLIQVLKYIVLQISNIIGKTWWPFWWIKGKLGPSWAGNLHQMTWPSVAVSLVVPFETSKDFPPKRPFDLNLVWKICLRCHLLCDVSCFPSEGDWLSHSILPSVQLLRLCSVTDTWPSPWQPAVFWRIGTQAGDNIVRSVAKKWNRVINSTWHGTVFEKIKAELGFEKWVVKRVFSQILRTALPKDTWILKQGVRMERDLKWGSGDPFVLLALTSSLPLLFRLPFHCRK